MVSLTRRYWAFDQSHFVAGHCSINWSIHCLHYFVSCGGISLQCFGCCTIYNLSCLWLRCYPFSSMATCMCWLRLVEWLVGYSTMFLHTMASHPSKAEIHVTKLVEWSRGQVRKKYCEQGWWEKMGWFLWWLTRGHYIIMHCTCTCIYRWRKGLQIHLFLRQLYLMLLAGLTRGWLENRRVFNYRFVCHLINICFVHLMQWAQKQL